MYHTLEMVVDYAADLEMSPRQPLERVLIQQGARFRAQIKPHVVETDDCPVEVADLFFEDGSATRNVPYAYFAFAD
jgi:hypothetical protein